MDETERKAYDKGRAGDYHQTETITEHFAYEQGKSDRAEEERQAAERQKNAPSVSKAFADLMKIVVEQTKEMGVVDWRGYAGGILIFFESMILLSRILYAIPGFGVFGIILGLFGGGFLFILHKLPAVRNVTLYAYPAAWVLSIAVASGTPLASKAIAALVCATVSYGTHYLFKLGFAQAKE